MDKQLVSIIVSVYNIQKYLNRCIDSIINQTYKFIEIILVDDGSNDNSSVICDSYKLMDKRVKVLHKINGGPSSARNAGLDLAIGNYIMFIDGDDYIETKTVEQLILFQNIYNPDLLIYDFKYVYENERKVICHKNTFPQDKVLINKKQFWENFYKNSSFCVVPWNKLYKKHIFQNIRYRNNVFAEDEYIIHEIIDKCNNIVILHTPYYYYVQRSKSLTHSDDNNNFIFRKLCIYECYSLRLKYLLDKKFYFAIEDTFKIIFEIFLLLNYENMFKNEIYKYTTINKENKHCLTKFLHILLFKRLKVKTKLLILMFCFSPRFTKFYFTK